MYIGQQQHDMRDVAFAAPSNVDCGGHWLLASGASAHLVSQRVVESDAKAAPGLDSTPGLPRACMLKGPSVQVCRAIWGNTGAIVGYRICR